MQKSARIAALMITALAIAHNAQADDADDAAAHSRQMMACEISNECVSVDGVCGGWVAVNKAHEAEYTKQLAEIRTRVECAPLQKIPPESAIAECVNHTCRVKE